MRNLPDDLDLGSALRDGLHALPVPDASPDFDTRVLDALCAPVPWWRRAWEPARPLLLGASCSLSLTLMLLHWTLMAPDPQSPMLWGHEQERIQARGPARAPSLDRLLDRPDLRAGSLAAAWAVPPTGHRPEPPHHAQAGRRAALVV